MDRSDWEVVMIPGHYQSMLDGRMAAFHRRGVALPPPMFVADSWFSDSKLMPHVAITNQGTCLVEGKSTMSSICLMGGRLKATTCSSTAIGRGGIASKCLGCAMRDCGRPVQPMAR